jgi:hypothetical protein
MLPPSPERRLPPITQLGIGALMLVLVAGIYLGAGLPAIAPMAPAAVLLAAAALLLGLAALLLARIRPFAWWRFRQVGAWLLLAEGIVSAMLEIVFLLDGIRGALLAVFTVTLFIFAVDVPLIAAFTVARFQDPGPRAALSSDPPAG